MTLKAEKFEELLTQELTSSLEPQRGKALAAFRAHLLVEAEKPAIAGSLKDTQKGKEISRKEFWFWSCVPSLAAACLAVVVTLKVTQTNVPVVGPVNSGTNAGSGPVVVLVPQKVEQTDEVTRSQDGLAVREERNRTTHWKENGADFRLSQPQGGENVKYEQIQPF